MGLTATWAVTTEPERFLEHAGDRVVPLLDWSPTTEAGNVGPPWDVLQCLEIDSPHRPHWPSDGRRPVARHSC